MPHWMRFNTLNQKNRCACVHCVSGDQLAALAASKHSPAIYRRVSVENGIRRRVATVELQGITSNLMNDICSGDFERHYATRFAFGVFQTRAEARDYARLPLSRQVATKLSALADHERSPAIDRRVSVENGIRRRVATVEPKGIASISMNGVCSADFDRRYTTRFPFAVFKPALKRGTTFNCRYRGRWDSSTPDAWSVALLIDEIQCLNQKNRSAHVHCACVYQLSALADYERSPAIHRRDSLQNEDLVA